MVPIRGGLLSLRQVDLSEVGDTPKSDNHIGFEWSDGAHRVYFTAVWHGKALSCHVGVKDRKSKLALRIAIKDFTNEMFRYLNPEFIFAAVGSNSVKNLLLKLGFYSFHELNSDKMSINFMRLDKWALSKTHGTR